MLDLKLRTDLLGGRRVDRTADTKPRCITDYAASSWRISPIVKARLVATLAVRDLSLNGFLVLSVDRWLREQGEPGIDELDPHFAAILSKSSKLDGGEDESEADTTEPAGRPRQSHQSARQRGRVRPKSM